MKMKDDEKTEGRSNKPKFRPRQKKHVRLCSTFSLPPMSGGPGASTWMKQPRHRDLPIPSRSTVYPTMRHLGPISGRDPTTSNVHFNEWWVLQIINLIMEDSVGAQPNLLLYAVLYTKWAANRRSPPPPHPLLLARRLSPSFHPLLLPHPLPNGHSRELGLDDHP